MADDPVAVPCFVSLGGVFFLRCGACALFLFSLLQCIVISVKSLALYRRMNLDLRCVKGREEVACVVQINFSNREQKKAFDTGFTARRACEHDS